MHMGQQDIQGGSSSRWWWQWLAIVGVAVLLLLTSWIWLRRSSYFPALSTGLYVGELHEVLVESKLTEFFVECLPSGDLFLVVGAPGWQGQYISPIQGTGAGGDAYHRLALFGPDGVKLELTGKEFGSGKFGGWAVNARSGAEGSWQLTAVDIDSNRAPLSRQELQHWIHLHSELLDTEQMIAKLVAETPRQREEIDKLSKLMTDRNQLRVQAEREYRQLEAKLAEHEQEVGRLLERARELERQVVISQQLTPAGKLISLARETLEREKRWVESMLRVGGSGNPKLEQEFEQSQKALQLQEQLSLERERVEALERRLGLTPRPSLEQAETATFDSLWERR